MVHELRELLGSGHGIVHGLRIKREFPYLFSRGW